MQHMRLDDTSSLRTSVHSGTERLFGEYFRCPEPLFDGCAEGALSDEGYFTFGGAVCYGRWHRGATSKYVNGQQLSDAMVGVAAASGRLQLPMDLFEVVTNLRRERYRRQLRNLEFITANPSLRNLYYKLRPVLGIGVRRHLQRLRLSGWETIPFPRWPVDVTVETLMRTAMAVALRTGARDHIPFIWFWPEGAEACLMMTHDVEGRPGVEFCNALMDLDESHDIRSSFQLVPTRKTAGIWSDIRQRGFEVNLHDWNHDGQLFSDKKLFLKRAALINRRARDLGCRGFRSAVMYREQDWYETFDFDYDMSVPNVAHLDPQRGGCCTVMPYFVGKILELPLTTVQDYPLFHILRDYSISLWRTQIDLILAENGLISFIAHPDYLRTTRARAVYVQLLEHLNQLRAERRLWVSPPGEIEQWWRQRHHMRLVPDGSSWRIEGCGAERARVAYAVLQDDRVVYQLDDRREP
jgi:hypothetical protein